jgi:hypothetical protein
VGGNYFTGWFYVGKQLERMSIGWQKIKQKGS